MLHIVNCVRVYAEQLKRSVARLKNAVYMLFIACFSLVNVLFHVHFHGFSSHLQHTSISYTPLHTPLSPLPLFSWSPFLFACLFLLCFCVFAQKPHINAACGKLLVFATTQYSHYDISCTFLFAHRIVKARRQSVILALTRQQQHLAAKHINTLTTREKDREMPDISCFKM